MERGSTHLAEIAALRRENDELRARLDAHVCAVPAGHIIKARLGCKPHVAGVLTLFLRSRVVSREILWAHLEARASRLKVKDWGSNYPSVAMCNLRHALRPHGIRINTLWGWGYEMPAEDHARLREMFPPQSAGKEAQAA